MSGFKHSSVKAQMERFNLSEEEAVKKVNLYKEKLKKRKKGKPFNSYSVEAQIERFNLSEEEAEKKVKNRKKNTPNVYSTEWQMNKHNLTEDEAKKKISSLKKKNASAEKQNNVKWQMDRFDLTKEQAEKKIKRNNRQRRNSWMKIKETDPDRWKSIRPTNKEHWLKKGFSIKEAEEKAKQYMENMRLAFHHKLKTNPGIYEGRTPLELKYYLDRGMNQEEAEAALKERQATFTLDKCIERHGKEKGKKVFKDRQEKWVKSLRKHFLKEGDSRSPSSKFANDCILEICDFLKIEKPKKEKFISDHKNAYAFDFTFEKKMIEFNGDYWHMNPKIYSATDFNKTINCSALEKWKYDAEKISSAEKHGYEVLTVWESEYHKNPKTLIEKCIKFLEYDR